MFNLSFQQKIVIQKNVLILQDSNLFEIDILNLYPLH